MSDTRMKDHPIGLGKQVNSSKILENKAEVKNDSIGIELPFGYCLIRGDVLRDLQQRCRMAEFRVKLRGRMVYLLMRDRN